MLKKDIQGIRAFYPCFLQISQKMTAEAAATFRESTPRYIGIITVLSQDAIVSSVSPSPSAPRKTAVFSSSLLHLLGYTCSPSYDEVRADVIQTACLKNSEALIAFCRGIQSGSPVDAFVAPEPSDMPGYDNQVIMAAGTFTMGSSIELSADAPLREPFAVYMQGGLNYHSGKIGILSAAQSMLNNGLLTI